MICEICKKEGAMFSRMEKNYCLVCWEDFLKWMDHIEAKDRGAGDEDEIQWDYFKDMKVDGEVTDEKR